ncbi:MAG: phosphoadenylyl-sulfate reductase [Actinobacteria bacterium]|nr:phosphoadenylyl-sulfate reductase [Actinomycetota bacterium]
MAAGVPRAGRIGGVLTAATATLPSPAGIAAGDRAECERAGADLAHAGASDVVAWATARFGHDLVVTASFQDCVLIDVVWRVRPDIQVVFLDTQYHFSQTLAYVERVRRRYDLDLRVLRPLARPDEAWRTDPDGCCRTRKVEPLRRALAGRRAWMTGLRRAQSPSRADTPVVAWDAARQLVKVNPLAGWGDGDVQRYVQRHRLPVHPLRARGYPSIGCWPCTRAVDEGNDPRAGRWPDRSKTECGMHA